MTEYDPKSFKPGEMDVSSQSNTFDGFMKVFMVTTIVVAIVCVFLLIVGT